LGDADILGRLAEEAKAAALAAAGATVVEECCINTDNMLTVDEERTTG
jgi:hypothetical protein